MGFSDHHIVVGTYLTHRFHHPTGHTLMYLRSYWKLDPTLLVLFKLKRYGMMCFFHNISDIVECFTAVLQELMELLVPLRRFVLSNM